MLMFYALPALPLAALSLPLSAYLPPFYAEDLGMGMGTVGLLFGAARLWDVITDPVVGALSDRRIFSSGRRKPWLILSLPLLLLGAWRTFMPPETVSAPGVLLGLLVLYLGYTALSLSHLAWGSELSQDYHERARVQAYREGALTLGMLVVMLLPAILEQRGFDRRTQMWAIGLYLIIAAPLAVAVAVKRVPEPVVPPAPERSGGWRAAWSTLAGNAALRYLLLADLIVGLGAGVTVSTYLFFAEFVLDLGDSATRLLLLYFVFAVLGVPLVLRASRILGKHRAAAVTMAFTAVVMLAVLFVPPGGLVAYAVLTALSGLAYSGGPILFKAIASDVVDVDAEASQDLRTGLVFSLLTLTAKVGPALAVAATYGLLNLVGFDPQSGENGAGAIQTLRLMYVLTPLGVCVVVAPMMWRFPGVGR
ncbi:MAG: GPH family glycoside/pentoside/hexuronide:cation symporter [Myxococcota bacterium]|jgi:GPH family glycoside/pentoside/hexuronide:cation symporter